MKIVFENTVFPNPINNKELFEQYTVGNLTPDEKTITEFYADSGVTYNVAVDSGTISDNTKIYVDEHPEYNVILNSTHAVTFTPANSGYVRVVNKSATINVSDLVILVY